MPAMEVIQAAQMYAPILVGAIDQESKARPIQLAKINRNLSDSSA